MKTKTFKTQAYLATSNHGGVEIMLNESSEALMYSWYGKPTGRWQQIKYTASGRAYFRVANRRFYLDNFMRTNF